ncbi:MAG: DUF6176 family protein [Pseudomonadota bacterium]
MESAAGLIKLVPNARSDLEAWRAALASRPDEVMQSLRAEGVAVEAWFRIEVNQEPYLLWFMRARSIAQAMEIFLASTRDIDVLHLEMMTKLAASQIDAELLLDFGADTV